MKILQREEVLDTHSPSALRDLRRWIETHPDDPDRAAARAAYNECVDALRTTDRHFHNWSNADIEEFDPL